MRPLVLLCATAVVLSVTAASCEEAPDVSLAKVSRTTVSEVVEAPASVTAKGAATVSSPANGTLATLTVVAGQKVEIGQTIGVIDSPEAQTRLAQATAALEASTKGTGSTKVNLGGTQKRLDAAAAGAFAQAKDAAAKIPDPAQQAAVLAHIASAEAGYAAVSETAWQAIRSVERGLASVGQAMRALGAAQQMQAQQAYDLAKSTVDALTLRAPIAGVVQLGGTSSATPSVPSDLSSLLGGLSPNAPAPQSQAGVTTNISVGSPVSNGTAIATIVDVSELGLVADVDETDVLLVKEGIKAEAELDAAPGVMLAATVTAIDVLPTANSRGAVAYKVHLVLEKANLNPRPGMSALVRLRVREAAETIAVPAAAVFSSNGQDTVWVRAADGKAVRRPVKVGVAGRDLLQITDGLGEGDTIVVKGADKVHEGDQLP
ncbi:efflux RND transporter periplasmic adaptor subunit [Allorhizocola rhizosphaerae]|uniref:efflux RND transporter periplasmic adaptor subunit n=1 Tax=Allorhizocola rhizosphaerae TaxID=1872709 RepID=UPI000E3C9E85|nr:efflux RND transporter periplasmic adaptor subunit [Allorhizocola rhizosphaerae]